MSGGKTDPNTYSVVGPGSWRERLILAARRKMYRTMTRLVPIDDGASVLDVGVTADRSCAYSNFFEFLLPHPERITALSDQDASWMESVWPGLRFVRGDARVLPFPNDSFDFVFSSAVIEHVGSRENQRRFLAECLRVTRGDLFITTPNRWFPVEMHSGLPFVHWLPPTTCRGILKFLGFDTLAKEENLNLLGGHDLKALTDGLVFSDMRLAAMRFLGFKSNLLMYIRKRP